MKHQSVFLNLGSVYRLTIDEEALDQVDASVIWASGSIGARAAQLKHWILCGTEAEASSSHDTRTAIRTVNPSAPPRLRGRAVTFTPAEVMAKARAALAIDNNSADNFVSGYVMIDDQRVSPKWLVRLLTGLPLDTFSTGDARRVLHQIGLPTQTCYEAVGTNQDSE